MKTNSGVKLVIGVAIQIFAAFATIILWSTLFKNIAWDSLTKTQRGLYSYVAFVMWIPALVEYIIWFCSYNTKYKRGKLTVKPWGQKEILCTVLSVILSVAIGGVVALLLFWFDFISISAVLAGIFVNALLMGIASFVCYKLCAPFPG